jgi:hypothetical protein
MLAGFAVFTSLNGSSRCRRPAAGVVAVVRSRLGPGLGPVVVRDPDLHPHATGLHRRHDGDAPAAGRRDRGQGWGAREHAGRLPARRRRGQLAAGLRRTRLRDAFLRGLRDRRRPGRGDPESAPQHPAGGDGRRGGRRALLRVRDRRHLNRLRRAGGDHRLAEERRRPRRPHRQVRALPWRLGPAGGGLLLAVLGPGGRQHGDAGLLRHGAGGRLAQARRPHAPGPPDAPTWP